MKKIHTQLLIGSVVISVNQRILEMKGNKGKEGMETKLGGQYSARDIGDGGSGEDCGTKSRGIIEVQW